MLIQIEMLSAHKKDKHDSNELVNIIKTLDFQYNVEFLDNPDSEANLEIKQHQICLNCQENGAEWSKNKKYYKQIKSKNF